MLRTQAETVCLLAFSAASTRLRSSGLNRAGTMLPFGCRNNKATRAIEIHPENSPIAQRVFQMYASGRYSLLALCKKLRHVTGTCISKTNLHKMLDNRFYIGQFEWGGQPHQGIHPSLIGTE